MIGYILGVLTTLLIVWLFMRMHANVFLKAIAEAKAIESNLEKLYEQYMKISDEMLNELEQKIEKGKEVLIDIEKTSMEIPNANRPITTRNIRNNKKEKKAYELKMSPKQQSMLQLAKAGWSIKDISQNLGVGQDQVSMVLHLYSDDAL
ncbi:MAG: hypothetical protein VR72_01205 [Clostridiaceae bacterium BRH_c20a]|nr:MAG: hypothetical protein VR72_01205 [Clostridiaceae bacterium BRH_c20a]